MPEKYEPSTKSIESILGFINSGEVAIPEIQRPFVWKPKQVRDLIDSLYNGYPTGYLIISQSPNMRLKDGTLSEGKKIMIDGQQRVTAMMTAILGKEVLNEDFEKKVIKISFNPFAEEGEESFKVLDTAILKDFIIPVNIFIGLFLLILIIFKQFYLSIILKIRTSGQPQQKNLLFL